MAGYVRQSSYSDGDTILAAHSNDEYDALSAAFHITTGHSHDGSTTGEGPLLVIVGALASGSIASGFGVISTGNTITTTAAITGGSIVVDNITIDANTITATTGALNLVPANGSVVLIDGTVSIDAGVITGATSITSTAFVGDITGNITGNASGTAATVTSATQAAITTLANVVTVGTIGTGVWQGTAINATYLDGQSGTNTGDEVSATLTVEGIIERSTSAENVTGTDDTVYPTVAGTKEMIDTHATGTDTGRNYATNPTLQVKQSVTDKVTSVSATTATYGSSDEITLWNAAGSAQWTMSSEVDGGVDGDSNWEKITNTTADGTIAAADGQIFGQYFVGNKVDGLFGGDGIMNPSVLSFDIIVHLDGASSEGFPLTVGVPIFTADPSLVFMGTITIAAANTWYRKSIIMPVQTSARAAPGGTAWNLRWGIGLSAGTSVDLAASSDWASGATGYTGLVSNPNLGDATANYIGITNIDLHVATVARELSPNSYQDDLDECRQHKFIINPAAANAWILDGGIVGTTTQCDFAYQIPIQMRATPTLSVGDATHFRVTHGAWAATVTTAIALAGGQTNQDLRIRATVASGLTTGQPGILEALATGGGYIVLDARMV